MTGIDGSVLMNKKILTTHARKQVVTEVRCMKIIHEAKGRVHNFHACLRGNDLFPGMGGAYFYYSVNLFDDL